MKTKIFFTLLLVVLQFSACKNDSNEKYFYGFWKNIESKSSMKNELLIIGKLGQNFILKSNNKKYVLNYDKKLNKLTWNNGANVIDIIYDPNSKHLIAGGIEYEKTYSYEDDSNAGVIGENGSITGNSGRAFNQAGEAMTLKMELSKQEKENLIPDVDKENPKIQSDTKILRLISPNFYLGDLPHLTFKNYSTRIEEEFEYDNDIKIPALDEIFEICGDDPEECLALKGQVYSATLKFKDIKVYDVGETEDGIFGLLETYKIEKRWVIVALKKI